MYSKYQQTKMTDKLEKPPGPSPSAYFRPPRFLSLAKRTAYVEEMCMRATKRREMGMAAQLATATLLPGNPPPQKAQPL